MVPGLDSDHHDDADDFDEAGIDLDDDAYDEFVAREFDRDGQLRDGPPVGRWIAAAIVAAIVIALAVAL